MTDALTRHVLLLAAHGSSTDTVVIERVRAHATQVAKLVPHDDVRFAFARGEPSLSDVVNDLTGTNATLTVVPFMTSAGHYAKRVMPRLLRESLGTSGVALHITKPIGASRLVASIMHRRALRLTASNGWSMPDTAIVVVGHGTARHARSRDTALSHARSLAVRGWGSAHAAFIDDQPDIATVVASISQTRIIVLPFLIGGASHAAVDVPVSLGLTVQGGEQSRTEMVNGRSIVLDEPLGVDASLADIAANLAVRAWPIITGQHRALRKVPAYVFDATPKNVRQVLALRASAYDAANSSTVPRTHTGTVYLVGAGPGAADLLTLRARRLLQKADVVVHDRLVSMEVLALARPDAHMIDVGKFPDTPQQSQTFINDCLVVGARDGNLVVRLKGGDPFVFGRGSEEVDACRGAGVRVRIVPGLSSALVAPLVAGIPLTARNISRGFAVVTAATASDTDGSAMHVRHYAQIDTLVVLMGRSRLHAVCEQLIAEGRAADTPVACIERATLPEQRIVYGTLATIAHVASAAGLRSPMVTVIGETARRQLEFSP